MSVENILYDDNGKIVLYQYDKFVMIDRHIMDEPLLLKLAEISLNSNLPNKNISYMKPYTESSYLTMYIETGNTVYDFSIDHLIDKDFLDSVKGFMFIDVIAEREILELYHPYFFKDSTKNTRTILSYMIFNIIELVKLFNIDFKFNCYLKLDQYITTNVLSVYIKNRFFDPVMKTDTISSINSGYNYLRLTRENMLENIEVTETMYFSDIDVELFTIIGDSCLLIKKYYDAQICKKKVVFKRSLLLTLKNYVYANKEFGGYLCTAKKFEKEGVEYANAVYIPSIHQKKGKMFGVDLTDVDTENFKSIFMNFHSHPYYYTMIYRYNKEQTLEKADKILTKIKNEGCELKKYKKLDWIAPPSGCDLSWGMCEFLEKNNYVSCVFTNEGIYFWRLTYEALKFYHCINKEKEYEKYPNIINDILKSIPDGNDLKNFNSFKVPLDELTEEHKRFLGNINGITFPELFPEWSGNRSTFFVHLVEFMNKLYTIDNIMEFMDSKVSCSETKTQYIKLLENYKKKHKIKNNFSFFAVDFVPWNYIETNEEYVRDIEYNIDPCEFKDLFRHETNRKVVDIVKKALIVGLDDTEYNFLDPEDIPSFL